MIYRRFAGLLAVLASALAASHPLCAQEASSGFDLRTTLTGQMAASSDLTEAPRSGTPVAPGFRGVAYPSWKMSDHWSMTGAVQLYTRPFYYSDFSEKGYGAKGDVLQASLNYARITNKSFLQLRAGILSTAFGSFLLRYDDAENPLVDLPMQYGYYYTPVSTLGIAGAQVDASRGKVDARVQFANSSPANPRSIFAHDQYGNWAAGVGYTIRQGLRIGVSGFRGPYLDRHYAYFFPGEHNPSTLPATGLGLDANWTRGHTTLQGEVQKFVMPYTVFPTYREWAGYGEFKRTLSPRWFVAARPGWTSANAGGKTVSFEGGAGFRPNRNQLIKASYEMRHYSNGEDNFDHTFAIQVVTTLHFSHARR